MKIGRSAAVLVSMALLLGGHPVFGNDFPDCNQNGVDDTEETATTFTEVVITHEPYPGLLGDLDGDGDLDLIGGSSGETAPAPGTPLTWRENLDGLGTFGSPQLIDDAHGDLGAGDFDADGDLDLALRAEGDCSIQPAISVYENLGAGTFASPQIIISMTNCGGCESQWHGVHLRVGDRDSDGDLDIFSGALLCGTATVATAWNDGTGHGWQGGWQLTGGPTTEVALGDVDSDGDADLIVSEGLDWFEGPTDTPWHHLWSSRNLGDLLVEDLDGDGDPDFVAERDIDITVYDNASSLGNYVATQVIVPTNYPGTTRIASGDLDGNGDPDLLWHRSAVGRVNWHLNTHGVFGALQEPLGQGLGFTNPTSIETGDIDLDGDIDVLVPYYGQAGSPVIWFCNDGNDCDGNRVPDECQPDCNANGIADACDIRRGTSLDCDGSGTPDECDTGCPSGSCDQDGDGCQDGVDSAPSDATVCGDTDGDTCDDCSGGVFDPAGDGTNADTDGVCDATDCDPTNNEVWDEPGAATGLGLSRDGGVATLAWNRPAAAGGIAPRYDVLRSTSASDFLSAATVTCLESDDGDESAGDADLPATGAVFHYLIRVENDCPGGVGSMGSDSSDVPRTGLPCAPVPSGDGLVLNEVNYNKGPDDPGHYVEVFNPTDGSVDLSDLSVIFVNWVGLEVLRVSLAPAGVLPSGGYLVLAAPSVVVDPSASVIRFPDENSLNGVRGFALFDLGATALVDALSAEGEFTEVVFTGVPVTWNLVEGSATPWAENYTENGAMVRFPDGLDTDDAASDWGVSGPPTASPTPGSPNGPPW